MFHISHFSKDPWYIETKICGLGVLIVSEFLYFQVLLADRGRKQHIHIHL